MEYLRGASVAKIKTELASYKEQVELFKIEQMSKDSNFLDESLTAGKNNLFYNTQNEEEQGKGTIKDIIENISDSYFEKMEIIKGELLINTKDNNEIKIAQSLGINVNPYDIDENGVLLSTGNNLALMDENGTVTIPDNVTEIGAGAFANEGLKTIIIPGTVKKIQANAFAYNSTLETVIMQEGVEEIGGWAFANCDKLKNIQFPESLTKISQMAFYNCDNLEEIKIPSQIKTIENNTFDDCRKLSKVTLNDKLETIGMSAFEDTIFSEISIPASVTSISEAAFSNNKNLSKIELNGNKNYTYEKGMLLNSEKTNILFLSYAYFKNLNTLEIPEGMTNFTVNISSYSNITKIIMPSTLTHINIGNLPNTISEIDVKDGNSKYEFLEEQKILYRKDNKTLLACCSKEENIDLYNVENIDNIGTYSFKFAKTAKEIILPKQTKGIDEFAFSGNRNLQKLKISESVNYIEPLFIYGNYTGKVEISSENKNYVIEDDVLYNKEKTKLIVVLKRINGSFNVINTVKTIGSKAFHYQGDLTSIMIPEGVTTIEDAFISTGLIEINIPKSVTEMSGACFDRCASLEKVTIYNKELLETAPWGAAKGDKVIDFQE